MILCYTHRLIQASSGRIPLAADGKASNNFLHLELREPWERGGENSVAAREDGVHQESTNL